MEQEWYSICCTAPPLFGLHHEDGLDTTGVCMSCRENSTFEILEDENEPEPA